MPRCTPVLVPSLLAVALSPAVFAKVDFGRQIRPILSDTCFSCHGPDEKNRMAGLRLDQKEGVLKVVTAGNHAESKLYQRINHSDAARRMPPQSLDRKLTRDQVALIAKWIDEGAEWQTHWAYVPPQKPELPAVKATT